MTKSFDQEMQYTDRAYRQDASQAMRGDVVLALIELITNADDAYRVTGLPGPIRIEIRNVSEDPYVKQISVSDCATGLSGERLRQKIATIGGMNEEHALTSEQGDGTRGLFGRGAKDVAVFGKAVFESVKDDKYSCIELSGQSRKFREVAFDDKVTPEIRKRLHLEEDENGLTAHIYISNRSGANVPGFKVLTERLSSHVTLRDIVSRNRVSVHDMRANQNLLLTTFPEGKDVILEKECQIDGYERPIHLRLWRLPERDNSITDAYTRNGLVVRDSRANYANTFLTLDHRPERTWFAGEVFAPEIDDLNRAFADFDENESSYSGDVRAFLEKNPQSLVLRSRDGLEKNHPYYRALAKLVEQELTPIFDAVSREDQGNKREGENLRRRLDGISRSLGQLIQQALDEAEVDEEFGGSDGPQQARLFLVPPRKHLKRGQTATLKLWVPKLNFESKDLSLDLLECGDAIQLDSDLVNVEWVEHRRINVMTASLKVTARDYGFTTLTAMYRGEATTCQLLCEPPSESDPELPLELQWQRDTYRIAPTRSQKLRVVAPIEMLGELVSFQSDSPLLTIGDGAELVMHSSQQYCGAEIQVSASRVEGSALITATCGQMTAVTSVHIEETQPKRGPRIEHEVLNQDAPVRSGLLATPDVLRIQIFAKHRGMKNLIGPYDERLVKFKNEDAPEVHAVLAEIIATEAANYVIQKELERDRSRYRDAASIIARQSALLPKFLVPIQIELLDGLSAK